MKGPEPGRCECAPRVPVLSFKAGSAGGAVRARVPAKPMKSVFKREPRGREGQKVGPKEAPQRAGQEKVCSPERKNKG